MNKKILKNTSCLFIIFCILLCNLTPIFAVNIGDTVDIVYMGNCDYNVRYLFDNGVNGLIITSYVGYYERGKFYPAYCIEVDKTGASASLQYSVTIEEVLNNPAVWRVLRHGFPYVSAADLGLDNDMDAFFATKQAVYAVLDGRDLNRYTAENKTGEKIVAVIRKLVDIGRNGTETPYTPAIDIKAISSAKVDNIDENYISQTFTTYTDLDASYVSVMFNKNQAPEGTILTDINNNPKNSFAKGELFKLLVPREQITQSIAIDIAIDCTVKTYPVLYTNASSDEFQDYAIVADPGELATNQITFVYNNPTGTVEVNKISKEYNAYTGLDKGSGLKNGFFQIEKLGALERIIETFYTDDLGQYIQELELGTYRLTELIAPSYYQIDGTKNTYEFEITYDGQIVVLTIENDNVNLQIDVDKTGTIETTPSGELEYNFDIQNQSTVAVENFIFGDKLPEEIEINTLYTGTFNQENTYIVEYITNNNSNWQTVGTYSTTTNNEIKLDSTSLGLAKDEYVEEFRFVFESPVEKDLKNDGTKITATAKSDLVNNQIFENKTYVNATYCETELFDEDETHTIVRVPEKFPEETPVETPKVLPRTGK